MYYSYFSKINAHSFLLIGLPPLLPERMIISIFPAPVTPEQNCHAEREQDRLQRLQMTSPSDRRGRSPHPGPDPNIELPRLNINIPPETHISSQLDRPCEHPMPVVPTLPVFPRSRRRRQLHGGAPEGSTITFTTSTAISIITTSASTTTCCFCTTSSCKTSIC